MLKKDRSACSVETGPQGARAEPETPRDRLLGVPSRR